MPLPPAGLADSFGVARSDPSPAASVTSNFDLQTPALVVEAAALEANLATMAAALPGGRLRTHVKAHKCIELARRQHEAGHRAFCCATHCDADAHRSLVGSRMDRWVIQPSPNVPGMSRNLVEVMSCAGGVLCVATGDSSNGGESHTLVEEQVGKGGW